MLSIGSLFSGIGGLELGLEQAGLGPVLFQAEPDPFCRRVLRHHWPDAKRVRDVRQVRAGRVPNVDLICGGFPCQDISSAGTRTGLEGERSGLWSEFARVVRDLRPRWIVIENVSRLVRAGLDVVLRDLAACGYDASWDCIPAAAVGAPHRRDRLFVVAWRVSDSDGFELRLQPERRESGPQATNERNAEPQLVGEALSDTNRWRLEALRIARQELARGHEFDGCHMPRWPPASDDMLAWGRLPAAAQPALCGVAHGFPERVAQLRALGNAVVPPVAEIIGRLIVNCL